MELKYVYVITCERRYSNGHYDEKIWPDIYASRNMAEKEADYLNHTESYYDYRDGIKVHCRYYVSAYDFKEEESE